MYSVASSSRSGPSPVDEADAAGAHHVEEQLLFRNGMLAPYQQFQQRAGEAPAQALQFAPAPVPVEHGVDRIQRPALVEHDAVLEQALPVEHDAGVVQEAQQLLGRTDMDRLIAQAAEMLLGDRAVLPLLRRHGGIRVAHRLQCALHLHPADTDFGRAVAFAQPVDRLAQRTIEHLALTVIQRAVFRTGWSSNPAISASDTGGAAPRPAAGRSASARSARAGGAGEVSHIGQPIGQRLIAERDALVFVLPRVLGLRAQTSRKTALVRRNSACVP